MAFNVFQKVFSKKLSKNMFNMSYNHKTTFNMGELIPTALWECMPGDKWKMSSESMIRFLPLVAPVYHRIELKTCFYFVPNRLLWSEWEDWITENSAVAAPSIQNLDTINEGSIMDYLGFPTTWNNSGFDASPMALAAYLLIYDEYWRDQNLVTEKFVPLVNGNNSNYESLMIEVPRRAAWIHDYFTSCLPTAQKGAAVTLPLLNDDTVDVEYKSGTGLAALLRKVSDDSLATTVEGLAKNVNAEIDSTIDGSLYIDPNSTLEADINAEAATINSLRNAFAVQRYLERLMRTGSKYIEFLRSFFGTSPIDARLQRPEYIGQTKSVVSISEVLSATETLNSSDVIVNPVGQYAGHGISVSGGNSHMYSVKEHGFIMGITTVRPMTSYQQGLNKMHTRINDPVDYPNPEFQHLGEQEVKSYELYADSVATNNLNSVFGYQQTYAEMRSMPGQTSGEMQSTLDFFHLNRQFATKPELNQTFIECNPRNDIFADTAPETDKLIGHFYNKASVIRSLSAIGEPGLPVM